MLILLNTVLRHVLSVCTLMFVILPFVNTMTQGSMIQGAMAASLPSMSNISISSLIPSMPTQGFASSPMAMGGSTFNGGGRPIFLPH